MLIDPSTVLIEARQRLADAEIDSLADSIKQIGQIQPIVVRQNLEGKFVLVVGFRRLSACKKLGINVKADDFADLDPETAEIIELEENIKRIDLDWRDHTRAIGKLLDKQKLKSSNSLEARKQISERLSLSVKMIDRYYIVYKNLDSKPLENANGIVQAYAILQAISERKTASIISQITEASDILPREIKDVGVENQPSIFSTENPIHVSQALPPPLPSKSQIDHFREPTNLFPSPATPAPSPISPTPNGIYNLDFFQWLETYNGPKFNFIHCDFPYGVEYEGFSDTGKITTKAGETYTNTSTTYENLLSAFVTNIDKFCSYSSHIMFWFSMSCYEQTKQKLQQIPNIQIIDHPLIWFKTDGAMIAPGAQTRLYPKHAYETAFLCIRGKRPLIKVLPNTYAAPHTSKPIHPSQKPEPVLNHFFQMFVDETTDVFDPTCGSGASIRSSITTGARSTTGLEIDPNFFELADRETTKFHNLRKFLGR